MEGFFRFGGARLYYEKLGRGEPVLMVPGMMSNHHHIEAPARILAKKGFSPIIIDLPLHGNSSGTIWTVGGLLNAIQKLVRGLGVKEYHCLGHSLGSIICSALVRVDPHVKSFCAVAPVVSDIRPAQFTIGNYIGNILEGDFSHKGLIRRLYKKSAAPGTRLVNLDKLVENRSRTSAATAIHDIVLALQVSCGFNLKYCRKPLMVVVGKYDPLAPPKDIKKFLPEHAKFVVLKKGHVDMMPRDFVVDGKHIIAEFFKSVR